MRGFAAEPWLRPGDDLGQAKTKVLWATGQQVTVGAVRRRLRVRLLIYWLC